MSLFNIEELQKIARRTFRLDERYFAADSAQIDNILQRKRFSSAVYQSLREWFTAVVLLSGTSIVVTPPK